VIGVPGDRVVIRDAVLSVNDRPLVEPYVDRASIDGLYTPTTRVPEGRVFVLGDNRARSIDSREFGPVAVEEVEGRVVLRLWPLGCPDPKRPCR
jgi:signal peptidase I